MHNLSRYLYSVRISRGYESVSDYLNDFQLSISGTYYRGLETGSTNPKKLPVDTAEQLCRSLKGTDGRFSEEQFFLHLIKDMLPARIFRLIVKDVPLKSFGDLSERQRILEHDAAMYKEGMAVQMLENSYVPDDSVVRLLNDKPHWLPIIHFIYLVDEATGDDLSAICRQNAIPDKVNDIIQTLDDLRVIQITSRDNGHAARFKRHLRVFRVPLNEQGRRLKDNFIRLETEKSLTKERAPLPFDREKSFVESKIDAFTPEECERLKERVLAVLAEAAFIAPSPQEERKGTVPFYITIVTSPRAEYLPNRGMTTRQSSKRAKK